MNVNLTLSPTVHAAWQRLAEAGGVTLPQLVRDAMAVYVVPAKAPEEKRVCRTDSVTVVISASDALVAAWDAKVKQGGFASRNALLRAAVAVYTPPGRAVPRAPRATPLTPAETARLIRLVEAHPFAPAREIVTAFGGVHSHRTLVRRVLLIRRQLREAGQSTSTP